MLCYLPKKTVNIDSDNTASTFSDLLEIRSGGAPIIRGPHADPMTDMLNIATQVIALHSN